MTERTQGLIVLAAYLALLWGATSAFVGGPGALLDAVGEAVVSTRYP